MLVRNLVEATSLQADPISILFNLQVQGLPVTSPLNVILLDQVRPLPTIEPCNYVQCRIVKRNGCMEVPTSV
jgi:hypothetical protein